MRDIKVTVLVPACTENLLHGSIIILRSTPSDYKLVNQLYIFYFYLQSTRNLISLRLIDDEEYTPAVPNDI